jgi:hypothetical protein
MSFRDDLGVDGNKRRMKSIHSMRIVASVAKELSPEYSLPAARTTSGMM